MADPKRREAYEEAGAKKGKRAFEMEVSDFIQSGKEKRIVHETI
jgi:hypothetical protein